jgi:uncharacterized protein (DUF427 family)
MTAALLSLGMQTACGFSGSIPFLATATPPPSATATDTATTTVTATSTPTPTMTLTATPTITWTPTITDTPTITLTPTYAFPEATAKMQAHCRYGPGTAYLHAGDLYPGDKMVVHNRNYDGSWLWVLPEKQAWHCWVSSSVVDVVGNVSILTVYFHPLPHSTLYGPPKNVRAERKGGKVTVTWDEVWMTEDDNRGYLIEATLCQNGYQYDTAVHTDTTSYTFTDETNCKSKSHGKLYTVEKHGYTDPVKIPWP